MSNEFSSKKLNGDKATAEREANRLLGLKLTEALGDLDVDVELLNCRLTRDIREGLYVFSIKTNLIEDIGISFKRGDVGICGRFDSFLSGYARKLHRLLEINFVLDGWFKEVPGVPTQVKFVGSERLIDRADLGVVRIGVPYSSIEELSDVDDYKENFLDMMVSPSPLWAFLLLPEEFVTLSAPELSGGVVGYGNIYKALMVGRSVSQSEDTSRLRFGHWLIRDKDIVNLYRRTTALGVEHLATYDLRALTLV